jgi:hypothetical protein
VMAVTIPVNTRKRTDFDSWENLQSSFFDIFTLKFSFFFFSPDDTYLEAFHFSLILLFFRENHKFQPSADNEWPRKGMNQWKHGQIESLILSTC